jgi:hypothetical protein
MESLLLSCGALASPTMCRFIPALSDHKSPFEANPAFRLSFYRESGRCANDAYDHLTCSCSCDGMGYVLSVTWLCVLSPGCVSITVRMWNPVHFAHIHHRRLKNNTKQAKTTTQNNIV